MTKKYQVFFIKISLIFFLTASIADAEKICTRGPLPTAEEYEKAKSAIKILESEFNLLISEAANHPGDEMYIRNLNKEERRRKDFADHHVANLRKVQLPQNLADCTEANYSAEKLGELHEIWHKMAAIYLENQNYPFNEKLIHQLMMNKTFGN